MLYYDNVWCDWRNIQLPGHLNYNPKGLSRMNFDIQKETSNIEETLRQFAALKLESFVIKEL